MLLLVILLSCGVYAKIPGNLGIDHVGIVVANASEASLFLQDAFGCVFDWEVIREPKPSAGERGWDKIFDVNPDSYLYHALMLKCGQHHLAQYIELFEWRGDVDQFRPQNKWLKFSDVTNSYIAFTVESVSQVVNHLRDVVFPKYPGTRFIQDPPMTFPLRGELCTSFFIVSPWGQWIEISEWSESTAKHPHHSRAATSQEVTTDKGKVERFKSSSKDDNEVGMLASQLETPVVLVDLDAVDANIGLLRSRLSSPSRLVRWFPPVKAHRSSAFANYLLNRGATGVVVLTVAEAEVFAEGLQGRATVLHLANQLVIPTKILRLCGLVARFPEVKFRVNCDSEQNAVDLQNAAKGANVVLNVMLEVNIGHNRSGVHPSEALQLAQSIKSKSNLRLAGITGYEGHTPVLQPQEKTVQVRLAHEKLRAAKEKIESGGIVVEEVSAGGSSNYVDALEMNVITELQAGGGVTIPDKLYLTLAHLSNFGHKNAIKVESTVVSVQRLPDRAISDAGFKTVGWHPFAGFPLIATENTCLEVSGLSAEHCRLRLSENCTAVNVRLGQRIEFIPGYGDSFLGNQKKFYGIRKGVVEEVFRVDAFGASR